MRSEREDQLHEQFVALFVLRILREAIFSTNLAEFAWPVGKSRGCALVGQGIELAAIGPVKAPAGKPSSAQLIVSRCVPAECSLFTRELLTLAPYELASSYERVIDGTAQRLPAQSCINAVKLTNEV